MHPPATSPPKLGTTTKDVVASTRNRDLLGGRRQNGELSSRSSVTRSTSRRPLPRPSRRDSGKKPGAAISTWCAPASSRSSQIPRPTVTPSIATLAFAGTGSTRSAAASSSAASVSGTVRSTSTVTWMGGVPRLPSPRNATTCGPGGSRPSHGAAPTRLPSTITSTALPPCSATRTCPDGPSRARRATTRTVPPP